MAELERALHAVNGSYLPLARSTNHFTLCQHNVNPPWLSLKMFFMRSMMRSAPPGVSSPMSPGEGSSCRTAHLHAMAQYKKWAAWAGGGVWHTRAAGWPSTSGSAAPRAAVPHSPVWNQPSLSSTSSVLSCGHPRVEQAGIGSHRVK